MRDIVTARQFEADELDDLFARTDLMEEQLTTNKRELAQKHIGEKVATLFYEPSTRTRLSFESAAVSLGMGYISTENAQLFSSAVKGETLEDTIRTINHYADIIVLRYHEIGGAERAAAVSEVPLINAGDGKGEHPTQAFLDMRTVRHEHKRNKDLKYVIGGDLAHGRTARSLALMISKYNGNHIEFVSTPELQIGRDIVSHLEQEGTSHHETDDIYEAVRGADVLYWTRMQLERMSEEERLLLQSNFIVNQSVLEVMKEDAIILHPFPRNDEIAREVDKDPRAKYLDSQVASGLHSRAMFLDLLINERNNAA